MIGLLRNKSQYYTVFLVRNGVQYPRIFAIDSRINPFYSRNFMSQAAQAARRLATGWTARVRSRVSEEVEIFLHSFVSRLALGSTQPPIK